MRKGLGWCRSCREGWKSGTCASWLRSTPPLSSSSPFSRHRRDDRTRSIRAVTLICSYTLRLTLSSVCVDPPRVTGGHGREQHHDCASALPSCIAQKAKVMPTTPFVAHETPSRLLLHLHCYARRPRRYQPVSLGLPGNEPCLARVRCERPFSHTLACSI
jgi:hypothetical protein